MIQLSRRFRRDDHFWFSFFHEAGHLFLHSKKKSYIDDLAEEQDCQSDETEMLEREADDFATRALFTPEQLKQIAELESIPGVVRFAKRAGIAPGIVVGQIQRQRRNYSWGNQLRADVRI